MQIRTRVSWRHALLVGAAALAWSSGGRLDAAEAQHRPHAGMLRFPDVSATHVAFIYANDLWLVPREGGVATRVAGPAGLEQFPRFNSDGTQIAFVGNYEGNRDLYTIPVAGGIAQRVTYHPSSETLCDWAPDGRLLYYFSGLAGLPRQAQLFTISKDGGLPEKLPVPYGANGTISADGKWLAYTPHTRDSRTWKRYRGGMATDIWLFNLDTHQSRRITDWEGTDSIPMWHGRKVYYLSDQGDAHRLNIWSYDVDSGKRMQVTHFKDYDVKWPSVGPGANGGGEVVFQMGKSLMLVDLANGQSRALQVTIPGDRPTLRAQREDAAQNVNNGDISSTGQRVVLEARGDIWTVPAEHGSPRNLTRTNGVAERNPTWSPDGRWIAYFSDETGEYELYVRQSDGEDEPRRLTNDGSGYRYNPTWSPDSKHITFSEKNGDLKLCTLESESVKLVDTDPWAGILRVSWSPDSNWIAYSKGGDNRLSAIWLYEVDDGTLQQVTAGMFNDTWPVFDHAGKYLFYASNREFSAPTYEDVGTTFVYADTDRLFVVPLRDEVGSPFAPKSDEEKWDDEASEDKDDDGDNGDADDAENDDDDGKDDDADDSDDADDGDDNGKDGDADNSDDDDSGDDDNGDDAKDGKKKDDKKKVEPVEIELEGFERRAILIPVDRGSFGPLAVSHDGKLLYTRRPRRGSEGKPAIMIFDLEDEDRKEKSVLGDFANFALSADGKKLLAVNGPQYVIVKAAADQKTDKARVPVSDLHVMVDPREEWRQVFNEAWRIERDFFYDPNMHGVDWKAVRELYAPMIADCTTREDVTFVIGEMISELNVGHAYVRQGRSGDSAPQFNVGMLGADFELQNGKYRITAIYEGAPWDFDARGPLSRPNVDVKVGDYLHEVNGIAVDTSVSPWAAFQGLAGKVVTLKVSDKPELDEEAREVMVEPESSETNLRYRAWVEHNRAYVDEKSNGRVGYIYVPNTGVQGQNELIRQFFGQIDKDALIIDERWNGGGQIPTRFIELLNRPIANYWARRDGRDWPWPPDAHQGPKCMLINGLAGSGGDYFPFYFKKQGLGKLIGMRTWGGLVGISGNPGLIDGGGVTAPTFAFYEPDGTWGIEGHGVEPDIEVVDDPAKMVDGGDPQLDAAIEHMLDELRRSPYQPPKRPAYPDRSGMGITEEDK